MNALLDKITRAVERTVEGAVKHRESVPVVEVYRGQTVWEGMVEVFDVSEPPPAVVYGWAVEGDKEPQYVTVKAEPPVNSPLSAVRAWLVAESKK